MGFRLNSSPSPSTLAGLCLALALTCSGPAASQAPSTAWRSLETEHYRFHFPAAAEGWTRRTASRMEAIRHRVAAEVGYRPAEITDVLVIDPLARANGSAWPVLGAPRMILYTTPPAADSVLGHYRDWGEIVAVHEDVHLAHLLRPSRHPWRRTLESVLPLGPIPRSAPRWLTEGYATLVEGRLTGWGRPHGDLRSALLRRWAQAGELPSYGALSGDGRRFMGFSMPYLVGSAYLEWLEARAGEDALRKLWRRMTAVEKRSFDAAFSGVFGDSPARLYNRFRAELTYISMTLEKEIEPRLEVGALWQDLKWWPSVPALDTSGERLAMVLRGRGEPARLVVWATEDDEEAAERRREQQAELIERDPEDVPAVWPEALSREPLHVLEARHGAAPFAPRWSRDGTWILFHTFEVDAAGDRRTDLFRWRPESGGVERLTHLGDVRSADPAPDGTWAVALRHRWGTSQLVRVDLATGAVDELSGASPDRVYDAPRISPDGRTIAYLVHRGAGWQLAIRSLDGEERLLPIAPGGTAVTAIRHPAWSPDGREIYFSLGLDGFIDLFAVAVGGGELRRLTRSHGAALAPAPASRGVFFLSLEHDGFDLRHLARRPAGPILVEGSTWPLERRWEFVPAVPPLPSPAAEFEVAELPPSRPYGAGPREWLPLLGGAFTRDGSRLELGARYGDLVGRLDTLVLGAVADGGVRGGAIAAVWRGWPVHLEGRLFSLEHEPPSGGIESLAAEHRGLELALTRSGGGRLWRWSWRAGALLGELEDRSAERFEQRFVFAGGASGWRQSWGDWWLGEQVGLGLAAGDTAGDTTGGTADSWQRGEAELKVDLGWAPETRPDVRLGLSWRRAEVDGARHSFDRLSLGGSEDSLAARSLAAARFFAPALPAGLAVGDRGEHQRVEVGSASGLAAFGERFRFGESGGGWERWLRLVGLEWRLSRSPFPILALPGLRLEAGAAVILDPPFEDQVEGWLVLRWHP